MLVGAKLAVALSSGRYRRTIAVRLWTGIANARARAQRCDAACHGSNISIVVTFHVHVDRLHLRAVSIFAIGSDFAVVQNRDRLPLRNGFVSATPAYGGG